MNQGLSPRQQIAERFSERLGATVERIKIGRGHRKRLYRVMTPKVCVDVCGPVYIVVNGVVHKNEMTAMAVVDILNGD